MVRLITPDGSVSEIAPSIHSLSECQIRDAIGAYHVSVHNTEDSIIIEDSAAEERNLPLNEKANEYIRQNVESEFTVRGNVLIYIKSNESKNQPD